jgi:LAO/AO transport system kinase
VSPDADGFAASPATAESLPGAAEQAAELLAKAAGAEGGDRRSLARLLSFTERGGAISRAVGRLTYPIAGNAYSVGMTGAPGAGKSTLTSRLIAEARKRTGGPVAVLAIDPSSPLSGGAILGDRVRMQDHALDRGVFIRSMATRGHLGGLAAAVPEAIRVLDASGWPLLLVETVGVGQVEVEVAASCDTVVVVLNPGWGDAVQANKAGLLEIADVLVINKADRPGVKETRRDLVHMLQLSGGLTWTPPIVETVASTGDGLHELWEAIGSHRSHLESTGRLADRRLRRRLEETERLAVDCFARELAGVLSRDPSTAEELASGTSDPAQAADRLVAVVAARLAEGPAVPAPSSGEG